MIRVILGSIFALFVFINCADAKYNPPEDGNSARTSSQAFTQAFFQQYNVPYDGQLTLEQFQRRQPTRDERRWQRQDEKKGIFIKPEQRFAQMDTDESGYVSVEEMVIYIQNLRSSGGYFY